jgi:hypothetical protein
MNTENIKKFVSLIKAKKHTEANLDAIKDELKSLEDGIMTDFEKSGMKNCSVDGMTVYIHRTLGVQPKVDKADVVRALKACGIGDEYVKEDYNTNSLAAYIREAAKEERELPVPLRDAINVVEVFSVRATTGSKGGI